MNNKAYNPILAYILIAILIIGTFVGVYALSLIDTQPSAISSSSSYRSGPEIWGTQIGTLAIRFELNQSVEIAEATTLHHFSDVAQVDGTEYLVDGRITGDVSDVTAPAIVHFDQLSFTGVRDKRFRYNANAQESKTLNAGWYRYVMTFSLGVGDGTLNMLGWVFGQSDQSEAGSVQENLVLVDFNRDGNWEEKASPSISFYLILEGVTIQQLNETEDDEPKELITTTGTGTTPIDKNLSYTLFIVGLVLMTMGFIFLGLGSKGHVIFTIIGILLIIMGLMLLAWASFVLLAGFWKKKPRLRAGKTVRVRGYTPKAPTLLGKIGLRKMRIRAHFRKIKR